MENITLTIGEYRDLIAIKKKDLRRKIEEVSNSLNGLTFNEQLHRLSQLEDLRFEYMGICEELERTAPKYCADDIPF